MKEENKTGVWIEKIYRNYITPPYEEYECSVCGKRVLYTKAICPYCFTEMTEVVSDI